MIRRLANTTTFNLVDLRGDHDRDHAGGVGDVALGGRDPQLLGRAGRVGPVGGLFLLYLKKIKKNNTNRY